MVVVRRVYAVQLHRILLVVVKQLLGKATRRSLIGSCGHDPEDAEMGS